MTEATKFVTLADCPPGLFLFGDTIGLKTEYGAMEVVGPVNVPGDQMRWKVGAWPEAYCADTGEVFWGGTSTQEARAALLVEPVTDETVRAAGPRLSGTAPSRLILDEVGDRSRFPDGVPTVAVCWRPDDVRQAITRLTAFLAHAPDEAHGVVLGADPTLWLRYSDLRTILAAIPVQASDVEPVAWSGREHDLKTWRAPFAAVRGLWKPWELRFDDRDYQVGDILNLREWDEDSDAEDQYTGEVERRLVTWLLRGPAFGLPEGYVIMSMRPLYASPVSPDAEKARLRERIDTLEAALRLACAYKSPESLLREIAVTTVDMRHGFTCEFAPSQKSHEQEYDQAEQLLRWAVRRIGQGRYLTVDEDDARAALEGSDR